MKLTLSVSVKLILFGIQLKTHAQSFAITILFLVVSWKMMNVNVFNLLFGTKQKTNANVKMEEFMMTIKKNAWKIKMNPVLPQ